MKTYTKSTSKGFTLIEVLIAVSVIGILTGATITVINAPRQQAIAEDGAKNQVLKDIADSIETFGVAENKYPAQGSVKNPLDVSAADHVLAGTYLKEWPNDFYYLYGNNEFDVYVQSSLNEAHFFKYLSVDRKIKKCTIVEIDIRGSCTEVAIP